VTRIRGKNDGPNRRNEHYDVGGRKVVPRRSIITEIKPGNHPDAHAVRVNGQWSMVNGQEYARDDPDRKKSDSVNR